MTTEEETSAAGEGDQQGIIEENVIEGMDLTYDLLQVLKRHGVTKDQHLECYWIFLAGEYCTSLMDDRNWTKSNREYRYEENPDSRAQFYR